MLFIEINNKNSTKCSTKGYFESLKLMALKVRFCSGISSCLREREQKVILNEKVSVWSSVIS